ncbi:MAG TPA: ATPase, partial [Treponema sp.]|nr:ATPase [Treponema sp.]
TNKRNELKKAKKIYFCDNGIRNAVLGDFTPIGARKDTGALWENYLVSERIKYLSNKNASPANGTSIASPYFWRTTDGMEIDYIEECAGSLSAYEFKWNPDKKCRVTAAFTNRYPDAGVTVVTPDMYQNFLGL